MIADTVRYFAGIDPRMQEPFLNNGDDWIEAFQVSDDPNGIGATVTADLFGLCKLLNRQPTNRSAHEAWLRARRAGWQRSPFFTRLTRSVRMNVSRWSAPSNPDRTRRPLLGGLTLPPVSLDDVRSNPREFLIERHAEFTTSNYTRSQRRHRRDLNLNGDAHKQAFFYMKYAATTSLLHATETLTATPTSQFYRVAAFVNQALCECVELRDSLQEGGAARAAVRFSDLLEDDAVFQNARPLRRALEVLRDYFDGNYVWDGRI